MLSSRRLRLLFEGQFRRLPIEIIYDYLRQSIVPAVEAVVNAPDYADKCWHYLAERSMADISFAMSTRDDEKMTHIYHVKMIFR